jgi:hypothetical protein
MTQPKKLPADYSIRRTPPTQLQHYLSAIETEHEALRKMGTDFPEVKEEYSASLKLIVL